MHLHVAGMKNVREERRQDCDEKAGTSPLKKILQDFLRTNKQHHCDDNSLYGCTVLSVILQDE